MSSRFPNAIIPECRNLTNVIKYLGIGIVAFMLVSLVLLIVGVVYYNKKPSTDPPAGTRATDEEDKNKKVSNGVLITLIVLSTFALFVGVWTVVVSGKLNNCLPAV